MVSGEKPLQSLAQSRSPCASRWSPLSCCSALGATLLSCLCSLSLRPFFLRAGYFKAFLGVPGFPTTAAGPGLSPSTSQPPATAQAHVWPPPSQRFPVASRRPCAPSARPPRGQGLSCLAETSPLDFLGHLQIPPVVEDARQPAARGPGLLRRPWRARPGGRNAKDARGSGRPRWSQARRWRIFGVHCAA